MIEKVERVNTDPDLRIHALFEQTLAASTSAFKESLKMAAAEAPNLSTQELSGRVQALERILEASMRPNTFPHWQMVAVSQDILDPSERVDTKEAKRFNTDWLTTTLGSFTYGTSLVVSGNMTPGLVAMAIGSLSMTAGLISSLANFDKPLAEIYQKRVQELEGVVAIMKKELEKRDDKDIVTLPKTD